jgi:hypothetical protein
VTPLDLRCSLRLTRVVIALKNGYVPDWQIKKNIDQTNKDFSKTGISLKLVKTDRTIKKLAQ